MSMNLIYCQIANTGKNFISIQNRHQFDVFYYGNDIWGIGDTQEGNKWINEKGAVKLTKNEAQTILDNNYNTLKQNYDNAYAVCTPEQKTLWDRATNDNVTGVTVSINDVTVFVLKKVGPKIILK